MYESMLNYPTSLFDQLERMRRELDDVFGGQGQPSSIRSVAPGTLPPLNVGRTPTSVEVYAFAPGLDASKIEVTLDRGVLRLSGERRPAIPENEQVQVYTRERRTGRFMRALSLSDEVDPAQVKATYRDGILHVTLPLRETARPQRITVQ
jgi:HSP20 family protein